MKKTMMFVLLLLVGQTAAGANSAAFVPVPTPTLDEVGLIGITIVVAIAGALAARRRKK